jgi:negative regulator of sigma E activity
VTDPTLDAKLAAYLDRENTDREAAGGLSMRQLVARVADGLAAHVSECNTYRLSNETRFRTLEARKSVPPMRDEEISRHGFEELRERAAHAAKEGEHRPDVTSEEMVRKVFEEEENARELAAYRRAKEDSRKRSRQIAVAAASALIVAAVTWGVGRLQGQAAERDAHPVPAVVR